MFVGKVVKVGRGHGRVYPETEDFLHPLRTLQQYDDDIKKVEETGQRTHGIIGETPLRNIPDFDHIQAYIPEYMHSVCQGVIKLMIQLWTLPKYSKKPWSISKKMKIINSRIRNCTPSFEITRSFDSMELTNWKASMFRSFGLFFFVILEDQLPSIYFDHFLNFSYGLFILLQEKVSVDQVKKVEPLFRQFVIDMENLYGEENIKINVHFLTHLPSCVLNWGCLWAHSAFIPEWFNGQLLNLFHGTQHVADQIASNHMIKVAVREEATHLLSTKRFPPKVGSLLQELLHLPVNDVSLAKGLLANDDQIELLGRWSSRSLTVEEEVALRELFLAERYSKFRSLPLENSLKFYIRFKLRESRSIFTTVTYTRSKKE